MLYKKQDMNNVLTIDLFNKLTGQETLHPLVSLVDLSGDRLAEDFRLPCDFYALICHKNMDRQYTSLWLANPGDMFEIPSAYHLRANGYTGVIFHPDLLCDTPLERSIGQYPARCRCHSTLTEQEHQTISDCLQKIDKELHHAIDRHSGVIIVSHIELLLNYCTRYCSNSSSRLIQRNTLKVLKHIETNKLSAQ